MMLSHGFGPLDIPNFGKTQFSASLDYFNLMLSLSIEVHHPNMGHCEIDQSSCSKLPSKKWNLVLLSHINKAIGFR